jgi:predicted RNase H-like nuclease (RuvC/YqgF family)
MRSLPYTGNTPIASTRKERFMPLVIDTTDVSRSDRTLGGAEGGRGLAPVVESSARELTACRREISALGRENAKLWRENEKLKVHISALGSDVTHARREPSIYLG